MTSAEAAADAAHGSDPAGARGGETGSGAPESPEELTIQYSTT